MNSKKALQLLTILVFVFVCVRCQERGKVMERIDFTSAYKFSTAIEDKVAIDTVPWKYQLSAASYSLKGDYYNALKHWDLAYPRRKPQNYSQTQIDSINGRYARKSAIEYITDQSKLHQIVIINEAHHNSFHRIFTTSLLQKLYDNGYKNLGLEALENGEKIDSLLEERNYPVQTSGFYTKDPQFGSLVRTALSIGYTVFPYEQTTHLNGKDREIAQAKNIQKVMESKPGEKFLIHCGFEHVLEGKHPGWEKTMAARLSEYTSIDPLTINQTLYSESSKPTMNHPLLNALDVAVSTVLIDGKNTPYRYERGSNWADIAVFHPISTYEDDRPNWLFKNGNRRTSISLEEIDMEFPVMILAFNMDEDINTAVPVDITEVESQKKYGILGLKKGKYTIVITNGIASVKFEEIVK